MKFSVDKLIRMLDEPFTYKDGTIHRFMQFMGEIILIQKYVYMHMNVFFRLLVGLPVLYFGIRVYVWYVIFVIWTWIIDKCFQYDFSEDFSMKGYFVVNFMRQILFLLVGIFMCFYYRVPWGWVCFVYSFPMALLATGYSIPVFDKRIYEAE